MPDRYFSYDPGCYGFLTHPTPEKAREVAEEALKSAIEFEYSDGDWNRICWGEIRETVVEHNRHTIEQMEAEGDTEKAQFLRDTRSDYIAEHTLEPVTPDTETP